MSQISCDTFVRQYTRENTHWYVSKIKTYTLESLKLLQEGLLILYSWFVDPEAFLLHDEKIFLKNFFKASQLGIIPITQIEVRRWSLKTQLLYTYLLDKNEIISKVNRDESVLKKYEDIYSYIDAGNTFDEVLQKIPKGRINDYAANARNFVSIYSKLGFAWLEKNKGITISSTGMEFVETSGDPRYIVEKQMFKWQLHNPALPNRYRYMKIFPYIFLLKLLLIIDPPRISKYEYALFVTKAKTMQDLEEVKILISEWRRLDKDKQKSIISKLEQKRMDRVRPLFIENLDSANKEIGFLTMGEPLRSELIDGSMGIILTDRLRAQELLEKVERGLVYINFENRQDWFNYYGDFAKGPTIEDAIDYYAEIGNIEKAKEVVAQEAKEEEKQELKVRIDNALKEKYIEDFYRDHLGLIKEGLKLVRNGQQFVTEIGRIDLLAEDLDNIYTIIEFKKDKSSDETIGQILRYMGWVKVNMADNKTVRGFVIAGAFDDKIKYARLGLQHTPPDEYIKFFKHRFDLQEIID